MAVLNRLKARCGLPHRITVDTGPEFISKALDAWAHQHGVPLEISRPGTPTDNPYIEAFNGRLREACLDQHWFTSLEDARRTIEAWRQEYTTERPHGALGNLPPAAFAAQWTSSRDERLWKGRTQPLEGIRGRRTSIS